MAMEHFQLKVPKEVKERLPVVAEDHGMTTPELIRFVLGLIATGKVSLHATIQEDRQNEQPSPAAD